MDNVIIRPFNYNHNQDYVALETVQKAVFPDEWESAAEHKHDILASKQYRQLRYIAERDGQPVGYITTIERYWEEQSNTFNMWGEVVPAEQGQGIGKALYDELTNDVVQLNPTGLSASTREDFPRGIRFLEDRGFTLKLREPRSILNVSGFDFGRFEALSHRVEQSGITIYSLAELAERDTDYERKTWAMRLPIRQDVPSLSTAKQIPFDEWQEQTLKSPNINYEGYMIAVDTTGNFVGLSYVYISEGNPHRLWTGLTGVQRAWRRKGVATAMKLRIIQFAQTYGATEIETDNEENNPMYGLNQRLGFKPEPAWLTYEKTINSTD